MVVGYGKKIRTTIASLNKTAKKKYRCPNCSRIAIKRVSSGVWCCQNCKTKFASDAFEFKE